MKNTTLRLGLTLILVGVAFFSCRKTKDKHDASEVAQQSTLSESTFNDLIYMADEAVGGMATFKTFSSDCDTIIIDTLGGTTKLHIDFGADNCMCKDGKKRSGKVIVSFGGAYKSIGNTVSITTENYVVNNIPTVASRLSTAISATVTDVISTGRYDLGKLGIINHSSTTQRTQTSGANTMNFLADDEFTVTGRSKGTTARGEEFTIDITTALTVLSGCRWIKGGVLKMTSPSFKKDALLDYGDPSICDNDAILSYAGKETKISL